MIRPAERLRTRPSPPRSGDSPAGLLPLGLGEPRDGMHFVPSSYDPAVPLPLVVMLHGAGGDARGALEPFLPRADEAGMILLAPESRGRTWDVLLGGYGRDVGFIDRALQVTMDRYAVDGTRVAVEGFSDGASYALGLGLGNGDLFSAVVAFSPGYAPPATPQGRPRLFLSHGVRDEVLPIDRCSRRIVPRLRRLNYEVEYVEFDDGHTVPEAIVDHALAWLAPP
ncbi:MAG: alpha/beta hydrolase [Actinomycetota bacterium]|nr:alpha/beta hydrolase [Actinomycetota bacterium]